MNKEKKSILKIRTLVKKNSHNVEKLIVSEEFMIQLKSYPELIEMDVVDGEDYDYTYLWGVPVYLSSNIIHGAVMEMENEEFFIFKNI